MNQDISFKGMFERLIQRWHIGVAIGLLGAVIAGVVLLLMPKNFAAQAVVMVDQQVELAVPPGSSLDDVLYVSRETVRLEELSYADSLWDGVTQAIDASQFDSELRSTDDLRSLVSAPHYQDGTWYFIAEHSNPHFAAALANAWAEAFVDVVQDWIVDAQSEIDLRSELEAVAEQRANAVDECADLDWARTRVDQFLGGELDQTNLSSSELEGIVLAFDQIADSLSFGNLADLTPGADLDVAEVRAYGQKLLVLLNESSGACQGRIDSLEAESRALTAELESLSQQSMGISPYLRVQLIRAAETPQTPELEFGNSALVGFLVGLVLWLMAEVVTNTDRLSRLERGQE